MKLIIPCKYAIYLALLYIVINIQYRFIEVVGLSLKKVLMWVVYFYLLVTLLEVLMTVVLSAGHGVRVVSHWTQGLPALRPHAAHQVRAGLPGPLVPRGRGGADIQVSLSELLRVLQLDGATDPLCHKEPERSK